MPRISQILIAIAVIIIFFMVLLVYRFMTLKPAYEFLDKKPKIVPTVEKQQYFVPDNTKG